MADESSSDLFVKLVVDKKTIIRGESKTVFEVKDGPHNLLKGFDPGQFIEVDTFSFGVGAEAEDDGGPDDDAGAKDKDARGKNAKGKDGNKAKKKKGVSLGQYRLWREGNLGNKKYPVELREVSFSRRIEKSSVNLVEYIALSKSTGFNNIFDSVILVKRRGAGGAMAGEAYLRMDFKGVLITDISWSNDAEVVETCTFVCRSVTVRYRPQLPDGGLGAAVPGFWSSQPDEAMQPL